MKNERIVPLKNYVWLGIILLVTCGALYYFYLWYTEYSNDRLYKPILDERLLEIKYNEIDAYVSENANVVVYASTLGNRTIRNFENKLYNLIDEYGIRERMVYLNVSGFADSEAIMHMLKNKYLVDGVSFLDSMPSILLFRDGVIEDVYFIKENNYSIIRLENYLKTMNVIDVYD